MKSAMHLFGKAVWLVTALASIAWGLIPFGYDVLGQIAMRVPQGAMTMILYAIGISGLVSLALMVKACTCCSACDKAGGNCNCH